MFSSPPSQHANQKVQGQQATAAAAAADPDSAADRALEGDKDPEVTAEASENAPPPPSLVATDEGETAVVVDVEAVAPEAGQASCVRPGRNASYET